MSHPAFPRATCFSMCIASLHVVADEWLTVGVSEAARCNHNNVDKRPDAAATTGKQHGDAGASLTNVKAMDAQATKENRQEQRYQPIFARLGITLLERRLLIALLERRLLITRLTLLRITLLKGRLLERRLLITRLTLLRITLLKGRLLLERGLLILWLLVRLLVHDA